MRKLSTACLLAFFAASGCSSGPVSESVRSLPAFQRSGANEYLYVADRSEEKLLVYPAKIQNPSSIRTVTTGLVEVNGIAVDSSGDIYLANGSAANVLEFAPGATSVLRTFSIGLHHPVNVAVGVDGTVYVADDNPPHSAIVEYAPTGGSPIATLFTPTSFNPHALAVDGSNDIFVEISGIPDTWPPALGGNCLAVNETYEFIPISVGGFKRIPAATEQNWGFGLDSDANLYVSDICLNLSQIYAPPNYNFAGQLSAGKLSEPVYQTVSSDGIVAIPNANAGSGGYVVEVQIGSTTQPWTVSTGLRGPIGAAIGFGP